MILLAATVPHGGGCRIPVPKVAHRTVRRSGSAMSAGSDKSVSDETVSQETVSRETMPDEVAREALLRGAAQSWAHVAPPGERAWGEGAGAERALPSEGVVNVPGFLHEYYRLIATE